MRFVCSENLHSLILSFRLIHIPVEHLLNSLTHTLSLSLSLSLSVHKYRNVRTDGQIFTNYDTGEFHRKCGAISVFS